MWLYRTGKHSKHPLILYEYQPNRTAIHPSTFLKAFTGTLHVDGYQVYKTMLKHSTADDRQLYEHIRLSGCWAHARRYFHDALKTQGKKNNKDSLVYQGLQRCDALFGIEGHMKDFSVEECYKIRQTKSKALVDEYFTWLRFLAPAGKTKLGDAITYSLNQEPYLRMFLEDGRLELSNNLAERSIKPFVISRKNFLFANIAGGAKTGAWIFSLVETAKANAINPFDYLNWVLKTALVLNSTQSPELVEELLPKFISCD